MRKIGRTTLTIMVLVAFVFAISGGTAIAKKKINIAFMDHPVHKASIAQMKRWAAKNDVELVQHPMAYEVYMQKVTQMFKAKSDDYDIIWHNDDWGQLWCSYMANHDSVTKKDPGLMNRFLLDDIWTCKLDDGQIHDTAVPFVLTGGILYYRTDLISENEVPKTWKEFQDLSSRLVKEGKVKYGYVGGMKYPHTWFSLLWSMWANECDILQPPLSRSNAKLAEKNWTTMFENPCMQQHLEFWWENVNELKIVPPDMPGYTRNEANAVFMAGNAAMISADNVFYNTLNDPAKSKVAGKLGFARWPKGPSQEGPTTMWYASWAWAVPKFISDERKARAMDLLAWYLNDEQAQKAVWVDSGGYPPNLKVQAMLEAEDPVYKQSAGTLVKSEREVAPAYYFKAWPKLHSMYSSYSIKAVTAKNKSDIPGICKEAAKAIHKALCRPPDCKP